MKKLIALILIQYSTSLLADLKVFPTRVLFEGRTLNASVQLRHVGQKETRYKIETLFYKVDHEGKYSEVSTPSIEVHRFVGPLLKFSPRQVSLKPGVEQVVRLMIRPRAGLEKGEYRGHIRFATFDEQDAVELHKSQQNKNGVAMAIRAQRAVAIPVVYRHGDLSASLAISKMKASADAARVTFIKSGNRSVYGDATLYHHISGRERIKVGLIRGLSFYTDKVEISLPLNMKPKEKLPMGGSLEVEFRETDNKEGKLVQFNTPL